MDTFLKYWPIWLPAALYVTYELVALATQVTHAQRRIPTLSELVWKATKDWNLMKRVLFVVVVSPLWFILLWHFFFGFGRPHNQRVGDH